MKRLVLTAALVSALAAAGAAQTPDVAGDAGQGRPRGARRGLPAGPPAPLDTLGNDQVFQILDAFVMSSAQSALQLSDTQFSAFFSRMMRLQSLQRQNRRARQRVLNELRQMIGPRARGAVDDAAIAAKTKEFDDLEAQILAEEQRALGDIDQVLQVRQRARLRVFLENMEQRKLDLLMKARQGARSSAPGPPASGGRGPQHP